VIRILFETGARVSISELIGLAGAADADAVATVRGFFGDRLKVLLRDQGKRHDLVDAVFALGDDDLVRVSARIDALSDFLSTDDGSNLLAGFKRAANILAAEARKGALPDGEPTPTATPPEQAALYEALAKQGAHIDTALATESFAVAMAALASLRGPVDAFFEKVLVNDPDPDTRSNRLRLIGQVRGQMLKLADFGLISG